MANGGPIGVETVTAGEQDGDPFRTPNMAVVAAIPYYPRLQALPPGCHFRSGLRSLAYALLFASGNPRPPEHFINADQFEAFLEFREFRGAAWLKDLVVYRDSSHTIAGLSYLRCWEVGYTPYRLPAWQKGRDAHAIIGLSEPHRGYAFVPDIEPFLAEDRSYVVVRHRLHFKIGRLGDLGMWLTTGGHRAPYAVAELSCTIRADESWQLDLNGSSIPSESLYVDWQLRDRYDMEPCTSGEIRDFIEAGVCQDAPMRTLLSVTSPYPIGSSTR